MMSSAIISASACLLLVARGVSSFVPLRPLTLLPPANRFDAVARNEDGSSLINEEEPLKLVANPFYGLGRILQALKAPDDKRLTLEQNEERRQKKIQSWETALAATNVQWGSRQAVTNIPVWATPEVLQGGFASGKLLATLQENDVPNQYYLSEEGLQELDCALQNGHYRVRLPEHGALLMVVWLLQRGEYEHADTIVKEIAPYFDRLRFYPEMANTSLDMSSLSVITVKDAMNIIQHMIDIECNIHVPRTRKKVSNRRAVYDWWPLKQRLFSVWMETCDDSCTPCTRFLPNWYARARLLVEEFEELAERDSYTNGNRGRQGSTYQMATCLKKCLCEGVSSLSQKELDYLQNILIGTIRKRGKPDSSEFASYIKEIQKYAPPDNTQQMKALLGRLGDEDPEIGLSQETIDDLTSDLPASLGKVLNRTRMGSIEELVGLGLVPSVDELANLIPKLIGQSAHSNVPDEALRRLGSALDVAFQSRRSLLLFNLESQVRFDELPWAKPLFRYKQGKNDEAMATLKLITQTAMRTFPQTILPNKLLQAMRTLDEANGVGLYLTDELASDIFMGAFSIKFSRSASLAAELLKGTVYERYYELDYGQFEETKEIDSAFGASQRPSSFLIDICTDRAQAYFGDHLAYGQISRNRQIIEQQQIITTQNLAAIYLKLKPELDESKLVIIIWEWIIKETYRCHELIGYADWSVHKNIGYAWRQLLFFVSFAGNTDTLLKTMSERLVEDAYMIDRRVDVSNIVKIREFLEEKLLGELKKVLAGERHDSILLGYRLWSSRDILPTLVPASRITESYHKCNQNVH